MGNSKLPAAGTLLQGLWQMRDAWGWPLGLLRWQGQAVKANRAGGFLWLGLKSPPPPGQAHSQEQGALLGAGRTDPSCFAHFL